MSFWLLIVEGTNELNNKITKSHHYGGLLDYIYAYLNNISQMLYASNTKHKHSYSIWVIRVTWVHYAIGFKFEGVVTFLLRLSMKLQR